MNRIYSLISCFILLSFTAFSGTFSGKVIDKETGEPLIGATVRLDKKGFYDATGLDGSFSIKQLPAGKYQVKISYVSYQSITKEITIGKEDVSLNFRLEPDAKQSLNEVVVRASADKSTENSARFSERKANQLINIVSGRAIEISPDLTVANLIQRVSGVSIERNSNGDGQYAILRGMDKRYNYTLVNGIKIPSPDNKYRYVPLDIFPSELLGRLEVFKTLTPDLEGDAVGGVVNMVMKDAPNQLEIKGNLAGGYNELFMNRDFTSFNASQIQQLSPYELNGNTYSATAKDFPKGTLTLQSKKPMPNIVGGLSIGNRFLQNRLGVILAGSFQNTYRGSNSKFYSSTVYDTERTSRITSLAERQYSERQERLGLHAKIDFRLNENNKIQWYNAYMNLLNEQLRDTKTTEYSSGGYDPEKGNAGLTFGIRSRLTQQQIFNSTLQGTHQLNDKLKFNWSAVYSTASNQTPDNTSFSVLGKRENFVESKIYPEQSSRRWEHNNDRDLATYLNLTYLSSWKSNPLEISTGVLYRDKQRSNFYNNYVLQPTNPFAVFGKDFNSYDEVNFTVQNPRGTVASALNYDATEKIAAGYLMAKLNTKAMQIIGGMRVENTDQGYQMLFPLGELRPSGNQVYTDFLPSLNIKHSLSNTQNLRTSYFRSINRPGFFEIVPGKVVNEEFQERGNPDLQRAVADNIDLRYEYFPNPSDQVMAGIFYKAIKNPIEYTLQVDETRGQDVFYTPGNFGNANNYGFELDAIKYFKNFGIKANYTYTHSSITTKKNIRVRDNAGNLSSISVNQTRPLYGQSEHIGNFSLLYKNNKTGWDAQLAASYTGERINTVSQFLDNDLWQEAFIQMDFSVEKKLSDRWVIFAKANNLLNTPMRVFIKNTNPVNSNIPDQANSNGKTLIREDYYQRSYLIGIKFKY